VLLTLEGRLKMLLRLHVLLGHLIGVDLESLQALLGGLRAMAGPELGVLQRGGGGGEQPLLIAQRRDQRSRTSRLEVKGRQEKKRKRRKAEGDRRG